MRMRFQNADDLKLVRVEVWSTCMWQVTQEFQICISRCFHKSLRVDKVDTAQASSVEGWIQNKLHVIQA
jgi:hypothetical protein